MIIHPIETGNKATFGISIQVIDPVKKYGIVQFWVHNKCLGKYEETYIEPNLLSLIRIKSLTHLDEVNVSIHSAQQVMHTILADEDELYSKTLLGFGETFDKLLLRLYVFDNKVIFLWVVIAADKNFTGQEPVNYGIVDWEVFEDATVTALNQLQRIKLQTSNSINE